MAWCNVILSLACRMAGWVDAEAGWGRGGGVNVSVHVPDERAYVLLHVSATLYAWKLGCAMGARGSCFGGANRRLFCVWARGGVLCESVRLIKMLGQTHTLSDICHTELRHVITVMQHSKRTQMR